MARPLRIEFEGAWYHVMNRGAGRRAIFRDDAGRRYFLHLLEEVSTRLNAEVHAYCLMRNHYHLMLRTPEGNLARIMRHVNGLYTQYYNRQTRQDGQLFRGRYKAVLVEADVYWTHLSRYIHRNPLEAASVRQLYRYKWSSYPAYTGQTPPPPWLHTRYILGRFRSRQAYRRFVEDETDNVEVAPFYVAQHLPPLLATERFKSRIARGLKPRQEVPDSRRLKARPSLKHILDSVSRYYSVPQSTLLTPTRGRGVKSPARSLAMYLCQQAGEMRLEAIAQAFGLRSYASAGATIRNVRLRLEDKSSGLHKDSSRILQNLAR
jgi:REP element-mobilizing transposase RayT